MPKRHRRIIQLGTPAEVIYILGGNQMVATLTNRKTQHVSNWKAFGRLPSETYLVLSARLAAIGYAAGPELWGITPVHGFHLTFD